MEFFKKEYPDTDVAVDVTYASFGDRLRAIRKEKGMSQDEFAQMLGTSKQVLSRYEIGQRIPKITQVQEYAKRLNVSADYLMGDSAEEAAFNSLCPKDHPPFYKILLDVMEQMGLDIPGMTQISGLTDRQVRTIIIRQMKDAPLPIAMQLSDALGVPLEVWTGDRRYQPTDITAEARQVARAYDKAGQKEKAMVRMALDLPSMTGGGTT
ncbi:helix-turn-helix transcriptional regulator [Flavonifractor sp. An10]|uniref:helix-turn-helix domain-containing protein n=1 Tax=Flavonifractor sp. An10 TaxID=1965537 RepID=UPI000B382179|nr:helix-turn-helix transcriptional regulator [Flavonifractor sp. An10]OUQ82741.1 hypothetical protein B5E42_08625 [Flavonifractor sp. An10]